MRILFYGGCHAFALRRIFEEFVPALREAHHLTNYRLIATKSPVPYKEMSGYDAVVFSPVLRKEGYNTDELEQVLTEARVPFVKYPWLQWSGYAPGAEITSNYAWHSGWWYRALEQAAAEYPTFHAFEAAVMEGDLLADMALSNLQKTTADLRAREADCDVKIAPFVEENYRYKRLFLTPDHAGNALYSDVCTQITDRLGLKLSPGLHQDRMETQDGILLPILPSVQRALRLEFQSEEYRNKMFLGKNIMSLRSFLRMVYDARSVVVAQSVNATRLYAGDEAVTVPAQRLFLVQPVAEQSKPGYRDYRFLSAAKAVVPNLAVNGKVLSLYRAHWQFRDEIRIQEHDGEQVSIA